MIATEKEAGGGENGLLSTTIPTGIAKARTTQPRGPSRTQKRFGFAAMPAPIAQSGESDGATPLTGAAYLSWYDDALYNVCRYVHVG